MTNVLLCLFLSRSLLLFPRRRLFPLEWFWSRNVFFSLDPVGPCAPQQSCYPSRETLLRCFLQHRAVTSVMLKANSPDSASTPWQTAQLPRRMHRPLAMARPPWAPPQTLCTRSSSRSLSHFFVGFGFLWLLGSCPKANTPTSFAACDCGAWSV